MSELFEPGPDGNSGDLWNTAKNADDNGADDFAAVWRK